MMLMTSSPINKSLPIILASLLFMVSITLAGPAKSPLKHYGLITLNDAKIASRLAKRFKAKGTPVFLVHDLKVGLRRGDFIKFKDKIILIDAEVWQTIASENALANLKQAPIIRIQSKASSKSWQNRSNSS